MRYKPQKTVGVGVFSVFCIFAFLDALGQTTPGGSSGTAYGGPPAPADAVIYEINVPHFSKEGTLNGVIKGLDGIKELGANVIYLMPIYPIGELQSSGSSYAVRDYTSVNKRLGSMDDLRALVRAAHQKKIAVILDWVANHTAFDNSWLANKDWYLRDNKNNAISPPGQGWNDVAQLNYKNMAMQAAMMKAMHYWVLNTEVDGFRCDYADGPPISFWKAAIASTRQVAKRNLFFLAESGTRELYNAGFDCISGFDFYKNLKRVYQENKPAKTIDDISGHDRQNAAGRESGVRYISNHDVLGSDGPVAKVFGNDRGAMVAFVVACMQGTPMIYSSQEGLPAVSEGVYPADYTSEQVNPEYREILAIRKNSNAIKRGRLTSYSNDDVYVVGKSFEAERVLIICNLRNKNITYAVPDFLGVIPWVDMVSQEKKKLGKAIEMEPFGYFILKAVR